MLPSAAASGTVCCRRLHSQLQQLRQQSRAQAGVDAVAPRSVRRNARTPLSQRTDATHVSDDGRDGWGKVEGPSRSHRYLRDNSSPQGWEKVNCVQRVALPCSVPQRCRQATSGLPEIELWTTFGITSQPGEPGLALGLQLLACIAVLVASITKVWRLGCRGRRRLTRSLPGRNWRWRHSTCGMSASGFSSGWTSWRRSCVSSLHPAHQVSLLILCRALRAGTTQTALAGLAAAACALEQSLSEVRPAAGSHMGHYTLNMHCLANCISCSAAGNLPVECHHGKLLQGL